MKNKLMVKEEGQTEKKDRKKTGVDRSRLLKHPAEVGKWFQILCFMNIPVFGFLYMLVKLLYKKTPAQQRSFAAAYLIYRILVLLLAVTVLFILYRLGLDFIDTLLKYADRMS